jgi:hypothetical protein
MRTKISMLLEYRYVNGVNCCHLLFLFVNATNSLHEGSVLKFWCHLLTLFINDQ